MSKRSSPNNPKVLCVAQDVALLGDLALTLRRSFLVERTSSAEEAIDVLSFDGDIRVVVADTRVAGGSGLELLSKAREMAPEVIRVLLVEAAEWTAIAGGLDSGSRIRLLVKPCPPNTLVETVREGLDFLDLRTARQRILEETLRGSVETLMDALSLANPDAFGTARRVQENAVALATKLGLPDRWQIELAALLFNLGAVTLSRELLSKANSGKHLNDTERAELARAPDVSVQLLRHIPGLEDVCAIIESLGAEAYAKRGDRKPTGIQAAVLRAATDFETLRSLGYADDLAIEVMRGTHARYHVSVLEALSQTLGEPAEDREMREMPIRLVRPGMVFADDVKTKNGAMFVTKGFVVTRSFAQRVRGFRPGSVREPVRVLVPRASVSTSNTPRIDSSGPSSLGERSGDYASPPSTRPGDSLGPKSSWSGTTTRARGGDA